PAFEPPALRPRDLAAWQAAHADSAALGRCAAFWRAQLVDIDRRARLPVDEALVDGGKPSSHARWRRQQAGRIEVPLAPRTESVLRAQLLERGATPFAAIAAALAVLIQRYGGSEVVSIGTAVSGRGQPGLESMVGFCVDTLPLVLRLDADQSFAELLAQAGRAAADLHAHQAMPSERLLAQYADARDPLAHPLFEVFLAAEPAQRNPELP